MRQCCSQSLHLSTVIVRQQQAVASRQKTEISTRQQGTHMDVFVNWQ